MIELQRLSTLSIGLTRRRDVRVPFSEHHERWLHLLGAIDKTRARGEPAFCYIIAPKISHNLRSIRLRRHCARETLQLKSYMSLLFVSE